MYNLTVIGEIHELRHHVPKRKETIHWKKYVKKLKVGGSL
jgi:uncharacterized protein with HEPN domain